MVLHQQEADPAPEVVAPRYRFDCRSIQGCDSEELATIPAYGGERAARKGLAISQLEEPTCERLGGEAQDHLSSICARCKSENLIKR